jgi:hypothetical protein
MVLMLVGVQNVRTLFVQQSRHPRHQSFAVRAINQKYG